MKWKVRVRVIYEHEIFVEAAGWDSARTSARTRVLDLLPPAGQACTRRIAADVLEQVDGPWVSGGWCGPGDVVVFKRSYGHVFSEREHQELRCRLESLGLSVRDSWNGWAGGNATDSVSFACVGRQSEDQFTEEQLAILLAPVEEKE